MRGTWFRVDSGWFVHPKFHTLSDAAVVAWFRCLGYCSLNLTDGRVPPGASHLVGTPGSVAELVDAGLLDVDGDGWVVHDYLEHQRSRRDADRDREKARDRQRRARERKAAVDGAVDTGNGLPPAQTGESRRDSERDSRRECAGSSFAEERRGEEKTPPHPPSRDDLLAAAVEAVMQRRGNYEKADDPGVHSKPAWLRSVRDGIRSDLTKQRDLNRLVANGAAPDAIADLIEPRTVPAVRPPAHDPDCPECGSPEGWKLDDDGQATRCTRTRLRAVQ